MLYLEGSPRWEYRAIRGLLERDTGTKYKPFSYRVLMQNADPEYLREEKRSIDELPQRAQLDHFHLVILGDVDPAGKRIGKDVQENLARFVRDGGAMVVIAGSHHTPHDWKKTALAEVLPIELCEPPSKERIHAERKEGYRPLLTEAGLTHSALRLDKDGGAGRQVWAELPPLYWHAEGYTARPKAEILAVHPTAKQNGQPLPLVVWQKVGKGKLCLHRLRRNLALAGQRRRPLSSGLLDQPVASDGSGFRLTRWQNQCDRSIS